MLRHVSPQGLFSDPFKPQRQYGEGDMRVDAVWRPVVDGTELQAALEHAPGGLHPLQLLVAEREIGGARHVVVAVHDELSLEPGERLDMGLIDARLTVRGQPDVAAIAA